MNGKRVSIYMSKEVLDKKKEVEEKMGGLFEINLSKLLCEVMIEKLVKVEKKLNLK